MSSLAVAEPSRYSGWLRGLRRAARALIESGVGLKVAGSAIGGAFLMPHPRLYSSASCGITRPLVSGMAVEP